MATMTPTHKCEGCLGDLPQGVLWWCSRTCQEGAEVREALDTREKCLKCKKVISARRPFYEDVRTGERFCSIDCRNAFLADKRNRPVCPHCHESMDPRGIIFIEPQHYFSLRAQSIYQ